jgi:hypothetical protein
LLETKLKAQELYENQWTFKSKLVIQCTFEIFFIFLDTGIQCGPYYNAVFKTAISLHIRIDETYLWRYISLCFLSYIKYIIFHHLYLSIIINKFLVTSEMFGWEIGDAVTNVLTAFLSHICSPPISSTVKFPDV